MSDVTSPPPASAERELTIDELAARVGMTVRNVRAYASRGLLPPPRLAGRTGFYNREHVHRLLLVRELLDRGYTLAAVEQAMRSRGHGLAGHALDVLRMLDSPVGADEQPEEIARETLTAMAGIDPHDRLVDRIVEIGLAQRIDDDRLLLLQPAVVRAGAQAIALGLDPDSVLDLLPVLSEHLSAISRAFVSRVRDQIWHPFAEAGMPEDEWARVLLAVETLVPVAGQAVVTVFQRELGAAIRDALGAELARMSPEAD
ncbi:MAG TPA: MerR family transcriptional regulator [Nocardioidaceae bacterium]|nr:MerR family transcriptional regulator [Nocardioidaceae bacterium]